jgi:DNA-binding LacI/PurR family transcriptional regulator
LSEDEYFDPELINACSEFCEANSLKFQVLDGLEEDDFQPKEIYFTLSDTDLFQAIKYAEKKEWALGNDIGIISLNDHPFKEIIAGGITVVSTHPEKLGQKAAEMILSNQKTAEVIEPSLIIRQSL